MATILDDWNTKQIELMKQGLQIKEIANVACDKRRNKDLQSLKSLGGPFTSSKEVNTYIENADIPDDAKNKRLYIEVRYARDTALSVPKSSDIFRLKKDFKNLSTDTYAANLKTYLDNVSCKSDVTMDDFKSAISKL